MNVRELIKNRLKSEKVACCAPLGVQHATIANFAATSNATSVQPIRCESSKTGVPGATDTATTLQLDELHRSKKTPAKVALKLKVAKGAVLINPGELACTWALRFADPTNQPTYYVTVPPTTRAEVVQRFEGQGLIKCEVDQGCQSCRHSSRLRTGGDLWCGQANMRDELKPAYGKHHPARLCPNDLGASCLWFETAQA